MAAAERRTLQSEVPTKSVNILTVVVVVVIMGVVAVIETSDRLLDKGQEPGGTSVVLWRALAPLRDLGGVHSLAV
jgi:hypothetical protein